MLYKALNSDFKSAIDHHCGWLSEPWVVGEWHEITGELYWDYQGNQGNHNHPIIGGLRCPRNGLHCSDDILWAMYGEFPRYIAAVETDGASIIHGKSQMWERMRVTSIKAWGHNKACLVVDWCEGRSHAYWANRFPETATLYDAKHYQGQFQDMLEAIFPVYQSLYIGGENIPAYTLAGKQWHLKPEFKQQTWSRLNMESVVTMAYLLPQLLLNMKVAYGGGGLAYPAEMVSPGSWELIRTFTADHWNSLEEL